MIYPQLSECQIGFIGAGKIAHAMASGLIHSGKVMSHQLSASAPTNNNLSKFSEIGCYTTNDNKSLFMGNNNTDRTKAKVIFLCVKPDVIKGHIKLNKLFLSWNDLCSTYGDLVLISVLAGTTINTIRQVFDYPKDVVDDKCPNIKFARIMPNTACSMGSGVCGISRDHNDQLFDQFLLDILSPLGMCAIVPETQLNTICGLGGSGIAFAYNFIHAMSDGATKMGLPRNISTNFAAQTVLGAALMVLKSKRHAIELRDEVTSPGGTTIYGLHALERAAFNSSVMDAIEAATKRADQLS